MAKADRLYEKADLRGIDSDYLCLFCYEPLYVVPKLRATHRPRAADWQLQTSQAEVCANPSCLYSHRMLCSDDSVQDNYLPNFNNAMEKCYRFDRGLVFRRMYSRRAATLHRFPIIMKTLELSAMNYILIDACKHIDWGSDTDSSACDMAIDTCVEKYSKLEFFGTVDKKSNLTDGVRPYVMKYIYVIEENLRGLGLSDPAKHRLGDADLYHGVEDQARAENPGWRDYGPVLQYPFATTCINRAFNLFSITRSMHEYPAKRSDLATLHSLLCMCKGPRHHAFTERELRLAYEEAMRKSGMTGDCDSFLKSYASGQTCAPVLVFDGQRYWFDRATLQAFISYIEPLNDRADGSQRASGRRAFSEQTRQLGGVFERWVRDKFRKEGWDVLPEEGKELKLGPKGYEYDCVAIDHGSKTIVVGEAKFENIPPSAIPANNMVDRLVLDKKSGLLHHAKTHAEKSALFRRHLYAGKLGLAQPLEYRVVPVIVTKHSPLIKKHLAVHLMSYPEFKAFDFKTDG